MDSSPSWEFLLRAKNHINPCLLLIQFPPVQNHPKITLCTVFFFPYNWMDQKEEILTSTSVTSLIITICCQTSQMQKKKKKALDFYWLFSGVFLGQPVVLSPLKIPLCAQFQSDLSPVFNTTAAAYKIRKQSSHRYCWNLQRKITKPSFLSFLLQNNSCSTGVIS